MNKPIIHSASEALLPQKPIVEIIESLSSEGSIGIISGDAGDGKTYVMLAAGASVSGGCLFAGKYKTTQGNVLFIDEESGEQRYKIRLAKTINGLSLDGALPFFFTSLSQFNFTKIADIKELEKLIIDYNIILVIIDAFMDVMPGADENAVNVVAPVLQQLRQIAELTKCAFLIIHHNNKSGNYRGSSAIKGAVDNLITVKKTGDVITFKSEKSRDTEPFEFSVKMHFTENEFYLTSAQQIKFGAAQEFVIKFLAQNGTSSMSDIKSNSNGCKPEAARQAVADLNKSGFVKRVDSGGIGTAGFYDLDTEGNKLAVERNWFMDPWKIADNATCRL